MELGSIVKNLNLVVRSGAQNLTVEVNGGYVGDLLSDVIANSKQGDIWVTRQVHQNIVAVATLKDLAGIILVDNNEPARETLEKAVQENVPVMVSKLPCFETAGKDISTHCGARRIRFFLPNRRWHSSFPDAQKKQDRHRGGASRWLCRSVRFRGREHVQGVSL